MGIANKKSPRVASQFSSAQHDIKIISFSALYSLAPIPINWILPTKSFDVYNNRWLPVNKDSGPQVDCFSKALARSRLRHQKFVQQIIFYFLHALIRGPFYKKKCLTAWISKYIHYEAWYEIAYLFPNFNATVELGECISNFISHFTGHVITYRSMDCYSLIIRPDSRGNKK